MIPSFILIGDPEVHLPSLAEITQISVIRDPILRNLQITQCYYELSTVFTRFTGPIANWCTFATWASKQAGQTIRKEDFKRLLESRLQRDTRALEAADQFIMTSHPQEGQRALEMRNFVLDLRNFSTATNRASTAVGRGNKKVFEKIGYEFSRFICTCLENPDQNDDVINRFCEGLSPGNPPEGQNYLRRAFKHYYQAVFTTDLKIKSELLFLGNLEIGLHEQTRLQPEIAESMDAGWNSIRDLFHLLVNLFPVRGVLALMEIYLLRIFGRRTDFDIALSQFLSTIQVFLRETITELMMSINLPNGVHLKLGKDLDARFAPSLQDITLPELRHIIKVLDPFPESLVDSGALDWSNLPDRLNFIVDFFRCYHEKSELLQPPFNIEQVTALKSGKLLDGRL